MSRQPSLRRRLLFVAVMGLVAVLTLELGVRVMNRVRIGRWTVSDPESAAVNSHLYIGHTWLGQILRPGTRVFSKGRHININAYGYRGPDFPLVPAEGSLRIACIGGSTTFDVKVSDDDKAWPAQLGAILRRSDGLPEVEVINAGTNGYALPRTIIDLALRTLDIQPDWIICYPGVNDLAYAARCSHQWGRSAEAITRKKPTPIWRQLLSRSELHNEIASRIRYAKQVRHGNWRGEWIKREDRPDPRGIAAFERNLTTLAGICQAHQVRLALVTVRKAYQADQPIETQERLAKGDLMDHPHLSLAGHYAGYATINRLIREAAERFDLVLLDQAEALPAGEAHFDDSVHFNDAGAVTFARFAAERLSPELTRTMASRD